MDQWNEHGEQATYAAFHVALRCVEALAGGTAEQPVAVQPHEVSAALIDAATGPENGRDAARATWELIGAIATAANMDVEDPFFHDQLNTLAQQTGPDGILFLSWWAWSAFSYLSNTKPDDVESARKDISELLRDATP